ncbi:MAG: DUF1499 domain-containing protein [Rhodospirillaceae bacterium]|nr:DUF1499 domain-containing protein [Rhodospirillaceae bacterium]
MRRTMEIFITLAVLAAVLVGCSQGGLMDRMLSPGKLDPIDFATLTPPGSPNTYLVAPPGATRAAPNEPAPEFDLPAGQLKARLLAAVDNEPRLEKVWESADGLALQFVQRSALMRWPDIVSVKLIDLGGGRSTLAIYSRSVYGYSDLGVNKARVQRWLAALKG